MVSKKFCAKEAVSKALGVGIGKFIKFSDILIFHDRLGAPKVKISPYIVKNILLIDKGYEFSISISDDYPVCVAFVILNICSIISKNGLLLTNHHCGYDAIQNHSSVEKDYLGNGFWAKSHNDELPNEGLFVDFLIKMVENLKVFIKA